MRYPERLSFNEKSIRRVMGKHQKHGKTGVIVIGGKVKVYCKSRHLSRSGVRFRRLVRLIRFCSSIKVPTISSVNKGK